ncbi:MAG: hypothetical protein HKL80_10240, partial [Acidimicrobiales bacterium]|nr:hypothetical protein [Acidimicrobiales bacterium]
MLKNTSDLTHNDIELTHSGTGLRALFKFRMLNLVLLAVVISVLLSACSSSNNSASTTQPSGPVKFTSASYDPSSTSIPSFYSPPSPL